MFKIITAAVFIAVMFAFSRLIAKPVAENFGLLGVAVGVGICLLIGFWIEGRDKRRRREAEQAAVRAKAARLNAEITDSLSRPPRADVIDGEFTVIKPWSATRR